MNFPNIIKIHSHHFVHSVIVSRLSLFLSHFVNLGHFRIVNFQFSLFYLLNNAFGFKVIVDVVHLFKAKITKDEKRTILSNLQDYLHF